MKRRTLLKAGLAGAFSAALPYAPSRAETAPRLKLSAVSRTLEVNGKAATVFGLTGPDGKPGLVLDQDRGFHVALTNRLDEETLIHWHGLTPPWPQDGVPNLPAPLLKAGEERLYDFALAGSGTHWTHAHTLQEQALLAAPLIVRSAEDRKRDAQEVVLLLHDFSFRSPEELLAGLTGGSPKKMDHAHMDHSQMGMKGMGSMDMGGMDMGSMDRNGMDMPMAEQMAMPMDLNDIEYDAYLCNDRTLRDPETVTVEKGGRVHLRVINAAASTGFLLDLGGLKGELIAVDGQPVEPRTVSRIPLTMAQRADILVEIPGEGGSFPMLALREGTADRTGLILATPGCAVRRLSAQGEEKAPALDLRFEQGLKSRQPLPLRETARHYAIDLIGNMKTYRWGMKGADRLEVKRGERIEVTFTNRTMMAHPMHLHGHHFQVVAINGERFSGALRDTVLVPPMMQVTLAIDAGNPGKWAFHCHHLYHMVSGMMAFLTYTDA